MFTLMFWKRTAERAVKTTAQTCVAVWTATNITNVLDSDWQTTVKLGVSAGLLSIVTSLGSLLAGPDDSPSVVN